MAVEKLKVNMCKIFRVQLLDNIAKLKKSKNVVFRFESLLTYLFFQETKKFLKMTSWDSNEYTMKIFTQCYGPDLKMLETDTNKMMKNFQMEMRQRCRTPPIMAEKYKDEICFMVETDTTCMEVVKPRVKFIEPMGYEMSEELIEGYAKIILQ